MKTYKDVWSDKIKNAHVVDPKRLSPSQIAAKAKAKSNDNRHLKLVKESEGGVPANAVQGGNTAGLGGENGEPGVGKKKKATWGDMFRRAWEAGKNAQAPRDPDVDMLMRHVEKKYGYKPKK